MTKLGVKGSNRVITLGDRSPSTVAPPSTGATSLLDQMKEDLARARMEAGNVKLGQSVGSKGLSLGVDTTRDSRALINPNDPSGSTGAEQAPDFSGGTSTIFDPIGAEGPADVAPEGFAADTGTPGAGAGDAAVAAGGTMAATGAGALPGAIVAGVGFALKAIQAERDRRQKALMTGLETQRKAGAALTSGTQGSLQDLIFGLKGSIR